MTRAQSNSAPFPYRSRVVVDVYHRADCNDDAFADQSHMATIVEEALAGVMQVDGASVVERRLYAEPPRRPTSDEDDRVKAVE